MPDLSATPNNPGDGENRPPRKNAENKIQLGQYKKSIVILQGLSLNMIREIFEINEIEAEIQITEETGATLSCNLEGINFSTVLIGDFEEAPEDPDYVGTAFLFVSAFDTQNITDIYKVINDWNIYDTWTKAIYDDGYIVLESVVQTSQVSDNVISDSVTDWLDSLIEFSNFLAKNSDDSEDNENDKE